MSVRLLFVCSGNLHRSVIAATLMREMFHQLGRPAVVTSAGTLGLQGQASPPEVHRVCAELGLDSTDHRSQGLNRSLIVHADRVIVMEEAHGDQVLSLEPESEDKLIHLGDYCEPTGDVADPIGQDLEQFRACRDQLLAALQRLLPELLVE